MSCKTTLKMIALTGFIGLGYWAQNAEVVATAQQTSAICHGVPGEYNRVFQQTLGCDLDQAGYVTPAEQFRT